MRREEEKEECKGVGEGEREEVRGKGSVKV